MVIDGCSQFSLLDHQRRKCMNVRPWSFSRFDFFWEMKKVQQKFPLRKKERNVRRAKKPWRISTLPRCVMCVPRLWNRKSFDRNTTLFLDSDPRGLRLRTWEKKIMFLFVSKIARIPERLMTGGEAKLASPFPPLTSNPFPSPSIRIGNRTLRKVSSIQER